MKLAGQTALVTGASSGLGEAFAEALAQRGCHLRLVARRGDRLAQLARRLSDAHQIDAEPIAEDLATPAGPARAWAAASRRGPVSVLINNAGFGTFGALADLPAEREAEQIALNVTAVVALCRAALPAMLARGSGAILNVASTAAFQPMPYLASYAATKAFVLSFSQAIRGETRGRGVRVLALCPGPTDTAFFAQMGGDLPSLGRRADPAAVVRGALTALGRDAATYVPGAGNAWLTRLSQLAPTGLVVSTLAAKLRPK